MKLLSILLLSGLLNFGGTPAVQMGGEAPDLTLENLEGEEVKLSSLRGNVVLVDFWASWCKPCRMKHPGLVRVYEEFHNADFKEADNFEIYSVSLDTDKKKWANAIVQDKLSWPYHVSDLKGWDSIAIQAYGIKAIPANILLDENGVIIGGGYKEEALKEALKTLM